MTVRQLVWQWHWGSGVVVGTVVAMMAVTGMGLALKPFVLSWVDTPPVVAKVTAPLPLATILSVHGISPDQAGASVTRYRSSHAPLRISHQKDAPARWVNPYSSAVMGQESNWGARFEALEAYHRWLGLTGMPRDVVRVIKAVACGWLVGLVITGVWLAWPWSSRRERRAPLAWHRWVGLMASPLMVMMALTGIGLSTESVSPAREATRDLRMPVHTGTQASPEVRAASWGQFEEAQKGVARAFPQWTQVTFRLGPRVSAMVQETRWQRTLVTFDESGHIQRMTPRANWVKWLHTGEWAGQAGAVLALVTAGCVVVLWGTGSWMVWAIWRKKR